MAHWTDVIRGVLFGKRGSLNEEIVIKITEPTYIKNLAVYTAVSIIANALSQCEIVVYENGEKVENENWYDLNVKPNVNENASGFWHKVVERMLTAPEGMGALVFVSGGSLYVADSYAIQEKRPFKMAGNLYNAVTVDDFQLQKTFTARDTILFKLNDSGIQEVVNAAYNELSAAVSASINSYAGDHMQRWKFKVSSMEAGSKEFKEKWESSIKKKIVEYVKGDTNVYVEYDGRTLDPVDAGSSKKTPADDPVKFIEEIYDFTFKAFHIPSGLLSTTGNNNIGDLMTLFLTFAVDPIADMIGKTLTGAYYDANGYAKGNYFRVDTSKIKHVDIFAIASDADKLISSGFATINEARKAAGLDPGAEKWLDEHILTKNYEIGGPSGGTEEQTL